MALKIQFYILSLWFLFFFLLISRINIPWCSPCSEFIGWMALLKLNIFSVVCLLLMFVGIGIFFRLNYTVVQSAKTLPREIKEIENINFETLSFLATYIIPLLTFTLDGLRSIIILVTMIILIGIIFIKTNAFYTNPTLAVLGFRVYKVSTDQLKDAVIIVKGKLVLGDKIETKLIDDNIYIAKIKQND